MGSMSDVGFESFYFEEEWEDVEEETEGFSKEEGEKERGLDLAVVHEVEEGVDCFVGHLQGCMGQLRSTTKKTFGRNLARLKVYGRNLGVWEVTSTQFSILEKELLGAGLAIL